MKSIIALVFGFVFMVPCKGDGLKGGSGTDIDNYCVTFTQDIIDNLIAIHTTWQQHDPPWNKYRVMTCGNSNTYGPYILQAFSGSVTGVSNAAAMNAFKDSTLAQNGWCLQENCKGAPHCNMAGELISSVLRWVSDTGDTLHLNNILPVDMPMIASVMIGTNNIRITWERPDSARYAGIIDKMIAEGVMPIIITVPAINGADSVWDKTWTPEEYLLPFNDQLRAMARDRKLPLIDIYQWMVDHGGPGELLVDWAHGRICGTSGADFKDDCLDGGISGSFYNAINYLLLNATYDIVRYVVNNEPFTPVQTSVTSMISGSLTVSPNPISNTTTVTVCPAQGANRDVFIKICDIKGRVMKSFQNSHRGPSYAYIFDASQCAPGIYFIKVHFGEQVMSKMIAVIR